MGTFVGHLVPGLAVTFLGLWHTLNDVRAYYFKGSTKFMLRFWYPLKSPKQKLDHLELILVLSFSIFSILIQVFDLKRLHFSFKLDNIEHATMFLQLAMFAGFTLFTELSNLSECMLDISGILVASVFGLELFLLHYHSADHIGLEGHYHWLMQLIVCVSFLAALCATSFPSSFPVALILSISVVLQGCWFIIMGFMLWVPNFIPQGCAMQPMNPSNRIGSGAIVCETQETDLRARALANLQFCWMLSAVLIFMAGVSVAFAKQCNPRRQSLEYEQLSGGGTNGPLAAVGFKQIQL